MNRLVFTLKEHEHISHNVCKSRSECVW